MIEYKGEETNPSICAFTIKVQGDTTPQARCILALTGIMAHFHVSDSPSTATLSPKELQAIAEWFRITYG